MDKNGKRTGAFFRAPRCSDFGSTKNDRRHSAVVNEANYENAVVVSLTTRQKTVSGDRIIIIVVRSDAALFRGPTKRRNVDFSYAAVVGQTSPAVGIFDKPFS